MRKGHQWMGGSVLEVLRPRQGACTLETGRAAEQEGYKLKQKNPSKTKNKQKAENFTTKYNGIKSTGD